MCGRSAAHATSACRARSGGMRRFALLVAALVVAVLPGVAQANRPAAVTWLPVPAGSQIQASDGGDRVTYSTTATPPATGWRWKVLDLRSGVSTDLRLPQPSSCSIQSGRISVAQCFTSQGEEAWYLGSFDGGQWTPVTPPPMPGAGTDHFIGAVGTAWFEVLTDGYHWTGYEVQYVSRLDGHVLPDDQVPAGGLDLDAPTPQAAPVLRVCAPLSRANLRGVSDGWGLYVTGRPARRPTGWTVSAQGCGSSRRSVLTRHVNTGFSVALRGNVAVWCVGHTGYVRNLRTGRTRTVAGRGYGVDFRFAGSRLLASIGPAFKPAVRIGVVRF